MTELSDEQTRLVALAHLKNGVKPQEVADVTGITYAKALKLRRQLHEAEENEALFELFHLGDAALEMLLDSVKQGLEPVGEAFGITEVIEGELETLEEGVKGLGKLDVATQEAAMALANRIKDAALVSSNSATIVDLADALCKLQVSFFGQGSHNPHGPQTGALGQLPAPGTFEKYLKD